MLRKLAIVAVIVFLQTEGPTLQVLTALGIIIVALMLQVGVAAGIGVTETREWG